MLTAAVFQRKANIPADIPQKKCWYTFFDTDAEKGVPRRKNQISAKEKQKTLECFLFQNRDYRITKPSLRGVRENNGKIQFHKKTDIRFHHLQLYLWE